jgi:hypothetical protein
MKRTEQLLQHLGELVSIQQTLRRFRNAFPVFRRLWIDGHLYFVIPELAHDCHNRFGLRGPAPNEGSFESRECEGMFPRNPSAH